MNEQDSANTLFNREWKAPRQEPSVGCVHRWVPNRFLNNGKDGGAKRCGEGASRVRLLSNAKRHARVKGVGHGQSTVTPNRNSLGLSPPRVVKTQSTRNRALPHTCPKLFRNFSSQHQKLKSNFTFEESRFHSDLAVWVIDRQKRSRSRAAAAAAHTTARRPRCLPGRRP